MNDKTLAETRAAITRMKRGDIGGLAILVERYQVQAVRTAYLITHDRALAEDVVQSAFVRVYQHIEQFDNARPFAPWFLRTVANGAIQAVQRRDRDFSLDAEVKSMNGSTTYADMLPALTPSPDDEAESSELRRVVWQALDHLPPEQRAAVVLRYYAGLSESEMSEALDTPAGTVKWRLHAARKHLRVLLHRFWKPISLERQEE